MEIKTAVSPLLIAMFIAGGMALATGSPAAAQCLSQAECDGLKAQLEEFREETKPLRERARELRREARRLPRGSEERRALRREARQLRREFRQERRDSGIREVVRQYRDGCRRC